MDDIVAMLGISKRTIYQHFAGKEEIAAEVIKSIIERIDKNFDFFIGADHHPIERLRQNFMAIKGEWTQLNPLFLKDIQKYSPQLWQMIEAFRSRKILQLQNLIQEGQDAGLFKKIDPHLLTVIFLSMVKETIRPDVMARHGFQGGEVFDAVFEIFLSGVLKN